MIRHRRCVAIAVCLLAVACSRSGSKSTEPTAEAGPTAPPGGVLVRFDGGTIAAEVADSPGEREKGLMHREALGKDAGMLFVFENSQSSGFWMKDTLIPLSIAFMRVQGEGAYEVLAILDMEPCKADPCPGYNPGVDYEAALEVNDGWFDLAGVGRSSVARVEGDLPDPT